MAPSQQSEPLLVPSSTSPNTHDDQLDEEDALLTHHGAKSSPASRFSAARWREIGLLAWAIAATAAVIVLAVLFQHNQQPASSDHDHSRSPTTNTKRNLIFMVSDGMGPSSLSLTRSWRQYAEHRAWDDVLELDRRLIGQSRTRSTDSWVTDSAAGATAFACGEKSYNGAISVLPDLRPCGSVMEAAHRQGYRTGLVVTTRITDATPATFVSHVREREMEDAIALQLVGETHPLGRMVDLVMGGGGCKFLPNVSDDGCRNDEVDVTELAQKKGWKYISSREEFDELAPEEVELPLLALLASRDIPYEIDRRYEEDVYPSLEEMTKSALRILEAATADSEQGFFVMIEGSRIDHAAHANDPAAQVREVLAYDRAMAAVMDFIETSSTPTLMVATSDHETGGLAIARQLHPVYPSYKWYPGVLNNASHSALWAAQRYHSYLDHLIFEGADQVFADPRLQTFIKTLAADALGIHDVSAAELDLLISYAERAQHLFADMVSRRARIGWSTHGHTAADVNIYASDPHAAAALRGNHENTEVGAFLRSYLALDQEVEKVTEELRQHLRADEENDTLQRLVLEQEDARRFWNEDLSLSSMAEELGI